MFGILKYLRSVLGLVTASPTQYTVLERLKVLATSLTTLAGYLDGVEGYLDGVEGLLTTPSTLLDGSKTVSSAGTAEALASSTACRSVLVQAKDDNTGYILLGNATTQNIKLFAEDIELIVIDDLSKVYVDAEVSGEGVNYNGS